MGTGILPSRNGLSIDLALNLRGFNMVRSGPGPGVGPTVTAGGAPPCSSCPLLRDLSSFLYYVNGVIIWFVVQGHSVSQLYHSVKTCTSYVDLFQGPSHDVHRRPARRILPTYRISKERPKLCGWFSRPFGTAAETQPGKNPLREPGSPLLQLPSTGYSP